MAWSECPRTRLDDAGKPHRPPRDRVPYSSPLRISHAVPTLTMRLPVGEYVASLAWFMSLRSRPLAHTPRSLHCLKRRIARYAVMKRSDRQFDTSASAGRPSRIAQRHRRPARARIRDELKFTVRESALGVSVDRHCPRMNEP